MQPAVPAVPLLLPALRCVQRHIPQPSPLRCFCREWPLCCSRGTRWCAVLRTATAACAHPSSRRCAHAASQRVCTTLPYPRRSFCFEHAVYQPTNVQRLFAAALDDGRSALSAEDLAHWEAAAVSGGAWRRSRPLHWAGHRTLHAGVPLCRPAAARHRGPASRPVHCIPAWPAGHAAPEVLLCPAVTPACRLLLPPLPAGRAAAQRQPAGAPRHRPRSVRSQHWRGLRGAAQHL